MTFSDSDWTLEATSPRPAPHPGWWLAALAGLGALAIALAWFGIGSLLADHPHREVAHGATGIAAAPPAVAPPSAPASFPAAVPMAPPAAASAVRAEDEVDREQMARLEAELRQRAREAAQQAAAEAARRKERAWERWYQRPAFCNDNPTSAQMIECANHHIRARRQFEELWAAGRLEPRNP